MQRRATLTLCGLALAAVLALTAIVFPSGGPVPWDGAHAAGAACGVVGIYQVGPSVEGVPGPTPQGSAVSAAARPGASALPLWALRGTLRVEAYSRCGSPIQGTFAVRRMPFPQQVQPDAARGSTLGASPRAQAIICRPTCPSAQGVMAATGTFVSDPAHGNDPLYVQVSATITSSQLGPAMGRPCTPQGGCPHSSVITSTVTMTAVTGYLQVPSGVANPRTIVLSFLPPPAGGSTLPPQVVVLEGRRGAGALPKSGAPSGS